VAFKQTSLSVLFLRSSLVVKKTWFPKIVGWLYLRLGIRAVRQFSDPSIRLSEMAELEAEEAANKDLPER
jgi:hypothetical protein